MSKTKKIILLVAVLILLPCLAFGFLYTSSYIFAFFAKLDKSNISYMTIFEYKKFYGHEAQVIKWINQSFTVAGILFVVPILALLIMRLKKPKRELYGNSRLATKKEALEALSAKNGVLCGHIPPNYLSFGGTQHILMEAPSRSGKGVGFVIPNCLNYNGSIVVLDIKGENYDITSKYRQDFGNDVYAFNPAPNGVIDNATGEYTYFGHRWNFLGYISDNENERVNDIQKIADFLYPDGDGKNAFFNQQGRSLFLAIVLYLFDNPELPVTPGEVYRQSLKLADKEYFSKICDERLKASLENDSIKPINILADRNFKAYAALSDNTASSVMGTVTARLEMWANPIIDAATCANDFDFRDLRRKKMSIYFIVTPDNLDRFAFIINLFLQQCFDANLRELPSQNKDLKYSVLFLLDEFTAIGEIRSISKGIAYFAGYNLRLAIIIQSVAQLTAVYGEAVKDTFVTNLALRIVFAPKENKVAQEISESLGYITETNVSSSKSKSKGGGSKSESESAVKRALFWPHELKDIGPDNQIVITDNIAPVICKKIRYFKDPTFTKRLLGATVLPQLIVSKPVDDRMQSNAVETVVVNTTELVEKITAKNIDTSNYDYSSFELPGVTKPLITSSDATPEEKTAQANEVFNNWQKLFFPGDSNNSSDDDDDIFSIAESF